MRCPICGNALPAPNQANPSRPFCSERCKAIDLARWLDGEYLVPGEPIDPADLPPPPPTREDSR